MKRLSFTLALMLLALSASAQQVSSYELMPQPFVFPEPNTYLCRPDSAILRFNNNSTYWFFKFYYNSEGLLSKQECFNYSAGGHYYNRLSYDEHQNLIVFSWTAAPEDDYPDMGEYQYTYNEEGLRIKTERYHNLHENGYQPVLEYTGYYYYDDQARLSSYSYESWNDSGRDDYQYIDTVKICTKYKVINAVQYPQTRETYIYSHKGQVVTLKQETCSNGAFVNNTITHYTYLENDRRSSALTMNWQNDHWVKNKLLEYTYNTHGDLVLAKIKLWNGEEFEDAHRAVYDLDEEGFPVSIMFESWIDNQWVESVRQADFDVYDEDYLSTQNKFLKRNSNRMELFSTNILVYPPSPQTEWYYEIQNPDGSITYQHLEYTSDTTVNSHRAKVIVRTNKIYDKEEHVEVSHEYLYEEDEVVYWWNKELQEFTTLYDFGANPGDEWEIKVGSQILVMHVDEVYNADFDGTAYRVMQVSDPDDLFSGEIICGIGHTTSFFPERLMSKTDPFLVDGLRCYWLDGELVLKFGDDDCDAIYQGFHSIPEITIPQSAFDNPHFTISPNPAPRNTVITLSRYNVNNANNATTSFLITSPLGQPLLSGPILSNPCQLDLSSLPKGLYFITIGITTQKLIIANP